MWYLLLSRLGCSPPTFLWTTTPWSHPKPPVSPPAQLLIFPCWDGDWHRTVPLASSHAQAMPGLCAALQTSVCSGKVGNIWSKAKQPESGDSL